MNFAAPTYEFADLAAIPEINAAEGRIALPEFLVPILSRSAVLLNLLLQDDAIDLELASAVVALDPGLTFAVLQLANPSPCESDGLICELPQALVTVGREQLQQLVNGARRVGDMAAPGGGKQSSQLAQSSVVRACVGYSLSRTLGRSNPQQCFLGGLLLDLPKMVSLSPTPVCASHARLLSVMGRCLPSSIVKVIMANDNDIRGCSPTAAIVFLANACAPSNKPDSSPGPSLMDLAALYYWQGWPEVGSKDRFVLLQSIAELAKWAQASVYRLDPWEFLSRLERRRPWE